MFLVLPAVPPENSLRLVIFDVGQGLAVAAQTHNHALLNFLSVQFAALALLSALMLPFFGKGALRATPVAWKWIAVAAGFSAAQAILITLAIGIWRDAAGVNVIYATRGLWSVVFVWGAGHWIGNVEGASAGNRTMWLRLTGAGSVAQRKTTTGSSST